MLLGQEQDPRAGPIVAYPARRLDAVDVGKTDVQQDQVRLERPRQADSLEPGRRFTDRAPASRRSAER